MRRMAMGIVAVTALMLGMPSGAGAAEEEAGSCLDQYLLCLNEASQEEGFFWRTLEETECGLEYFGCLRRKTAAS